MKKITVLKILGIVLLLVALAMPAEAAEKVRLTWTSGGTGGGWFVMAAGMAKIIEEKAPHLKINVIPGGGTTNQPVVGMKKAELGWGLSPFAVAARRGEDPYTEKYEAIRSIGASFSDNYLHVLAAEDTGVKTIPELVNYPKPIRVGPGKVGVGGNGYSRRSWPTTNPATTRSRPREGRFFSPATRKWLPT